jgi:hypothetical protein
MKVAAHPMLVAVALGLLGPGALTESEPADEDRGASVHPDDRSSDELDQTSRAQVLAALEDEDVPGWARLELLDVVDDTPDRWSGEPSDLQV